ncbi:MAG: DNA helicase RecQ [Burkholderiaceae bacterium]
MSPSARPPEAGLGPRALDRLRTVFGYPAFRGEQAAIIEHVAGGGDALVLMPTGGGKSLCYQIPALLRDGVAVVVSPLIALMQDQVDALAAIGVRAACLNSQLTAAQAASVEAQVRSGEIDLVYVAPERLLTERCLALLGGSRIALFAIDEAHCVSQWGHDFRPEYAMLSVLHERFPTVPRIALTATADPTTRAEIVSALALADARIFVSSFDRPNITYRIVDRGEARRQLVDFISQRHAGSSGIVYCLSRAKVDQVAAHLDGAGIRALPYHAGMANAQRAANQQRFLREDGIVMVATIAFGMGIDKPDVRFVAHLDMPRSIEGYYQETGRAGRDGEPAEAWMAYGLSDVVQQRRMIDQSEGSEAHRRVSGARLDAMLALAETAGCRRARLLAYFGEEHPPQWRCGNCDNCLEPPATYDATVDVQKLLSCIYRTGQRFGAQYLLNVLRGRGDERISRFGHDRLGVFGVGADVDERQWRAVIRQCIAMDLIEVDFEAYGALRLAPDARAVLRGERAVHLRRIAARPARGKGKAGRATTAGARPVGDPSATLAPADAALFEQLRAWRAETARERGNVPAYVVFPDRTLRTIAETRPADMAAVAAIPGIGEKKLAEWGETLLRIVAAARG